MTDATWKTPWHLWLVGTLALLLNAIGVFGAFAASILLLLALFAVYARAMAGRGVLR